MIAPSPDTSLCPLCGRSNLCAVTTGADPYSCWCMDTPVSREALRRVAPPLRGLACLCPACAALPDGAPQPDTDTDTRPVAGIPPRDQDRPRR